MAQLKLPLRSPEAQKAYKEGWISGFEAGALNELRRWAWWKNGTQYVGCGVYKLEDAIEVLKKQIESMKGSK